MIKRHYLATTMMVFPLAFGGMASAQTINGTLGSPSATTTIQGNQIPAPEPKFGGVIKENSRDSKPWWPPTIVPPKSAPNVVMVVLDDTGHYEALAAAEFLIAKGLAVVFVTLFPSIGPQT